MDEIDTEYWGRKLARENEREREGGMGGEKAVVVYAPIILD